VGEEGRKEGEGAVTGTNSTFATPFLSTHSNT
jgi:hypothetical protein